MTRRLLALALAALCAVAVSATADAAPSVRVDLHAVGGPRFEAVRPEIGVRRVKRATHKRARAKAAERGGTVPLEQRTMFAMPSYRGASLAGVVQPLAIKAQEIVTVCGARVISAVRKTFVAGTRLMSLHASGHAVDVQGNPACIYSLLHGWRGGYSTDYARVRHVHISFKPNGREWGARFVHRSKARRVRVAAR